MSVGSIEQELQEIWKDVPASEWEKLPADLSDNLDHYLYGTPKIVSMKPTMPETANDQRRSV